MIALDRTGVDAPERWQGDVDGKLPDPAAFRRRALEFEDLDLEQHPKSFRSFAPEVLPQIGDEKDFPPVWRTRKYVKAALSKMSKGHCAYCQFYFEGGGWAAVEHFRPKSLFPTLAYDWGNYFYSCNVCNNRKSNSWPATGSYVRPDEGDPSVRFVFHEDGGIEEAPGDKEARITITDFGLGREGLEQGREILISDALETVRVTLRMEGLTVDQKRRLVRARLPADLSPFSVAVRQCILRAWERALPGQVL